MGETEFWGGGVVAAPAPVVDRRAERIRATGEAEQARAAADAVRARTTAELWEVEARQAERVVEAKARARRVRREERAAAAARRVAALRVAGGGLVAGLPRVAGVVACVAPTLIATRGQLEFAREQMQLGPMSVLLPAMLEGAAWLLAWRRHQAIVAGESVIRLTTGVWTLALTAAAMNVWHGTAKHDLQVGVAFGLASLVGFALVELIAGQRRTALADPQAKGRRRLALFRLVRYPRLSFAAWSRRIAVGAQDSDEVADVDQPWRQVWIDRYGVDPNADARARQQGRAQVRAAGNALRASMRKAIAAAPPVAPDVVEEPEPEPTAVPPVHELHAALAEGVVDERGISLLWDHAGLVELSESVPEIALQDRAAALIADGAGRRRLARELDITEYEARQLIERARPTTGEKR